VFYVYAFNGCGLLLSAFCIDGIGKGGHGAWRYLVIELGYILLAHICLTIHTYLIF